MVALRESFGNDFWNLVNLGLKGASLGHIFLFYLVKLISFDHWRLISFCILLVNCDTGICKIGFLEDWWAYFFLFSTGLSKTVVFNWLFLPWILIKPIKNWLPRAIIWKDGGVIFIWSVIGFIVSNSTAFIEGLIKRMWDINECWVIFLICKGL